MIRKRDLAALVADPRLTSDAVRVVLDVALRGDGWHRIDADHFRALLHHPSRERLQDAVRLAGKFGGVQRKAGGKGHADLFTWSDEPFSSLPSRHLNDGDDPDSSLCGRHLNADSSLSSRQLNTDSSRSQRHLNDPASRARTENNKHLHIVEKTDTAGGGVEDAGGRETEPEPVALTPAAEGLLTRRAADLGPAADALRYYLALPGRVQPAGQFGYVSGVLAAIDGMGVVRAREDDGTPVPRDKLPDRIAVALFDLANTAEGTAALKRPPGELGNLWTKLQVASMGAHQPRATNGNGRSGYGAGPRSGGAGAAGVRANPGTARSRGEIVSERDGDDD